MSKLRAGRTYPYVLKDDREEEVKPTFLLRVLSCDEYDRLSSLTSQYQAVQQAEKSALLAQCLELVCSGWQNIDEAFSVDTMRQLLTQRECWELVGDATLEAVLSPDQRKKLESQSKLETA